ncbi:hypothetical protein BaRGS_00022152 [Batillaria attramentaria]|uniref:Uncharacterized protein n=1 Tax=Batillaria attramentaria TaxID=370345 RepID=A0ABD0KHW3_9CAEN
MQPTSWRSAGGLPSQPTVSSFFKLSGDSQFQGVSQEQNDQRTSQPAVAQGPQTCFAPHCHTTISRGGGPLCESCWRILNVANQNGSAPSSKEKAELDTTRSQEVLKFCRLAVDAVESKDALAAFDNLEKALRVLTANHDN